MIELLIQPAQFLIDALQDKTPSQLIELITMSQGCERLASVSIHLTALDILFQKYPQDYQNYLFPSNYLYDFDSYMD